MGLTTTVCPATTLLSFWAQTRACQTGPPQPRRLLCTQACHSQRPKARLTFLLTLERRHRWRMSHRAPKSMLPSHHPPRPPRPMFLSPWRSAGPTQCQDHQSLAPQTMRPAFPRWSRSIWEQDPWTEQSPQAGYPGQTHPIHDLSVLQNPAYSTAGVN